jgi:outer membrane protein assembly factor BamB
MSMTRRRGIVLAALAVAISLHKPADSKAAGDWPLPRGNPLQTGVAAAALPDTLELRWDFKFKNSIDTAPAIVGDTVLVASKDQFLYALSLVDGKEKWKYKAAAFNAPPSVCEGLIYFGDADGVFHCIEAATGKARWTCEIGGSITSGANFTEDAVLFGSDDTLHCLARAGKPRWKFKIAGGPVLASPAVVGTRAFASGCDKILHILDTADGKEIGAVALEGQAAGAAAVDGDRIFVGTMSGEALAIDWKKTEVLWRYKAAQAFYSSTALTDNLVILGSRDKRVHAIDRKTGKTAWTFATRGRVDSSPVIAGSRAYVASLDGFLYVLDLEKGTEQKKIKLDSPVFGSPAVGAGCLVVSSLRGVTYCFGAK